MGIDVYLLWDGMTAEERNKQYTGFDTTSGNVGYLREAYLGEPYATHVLISEEWGSQPEEGFIISNKILMERLQKAIETVIERHKKVYNVSIMENSQFVKSFVSFVKLHGKKEKAGLHPRIWVSY